MPRRFRLGWPKEYFFDRVDAEVRSAIDAAAKALESLGARIEEVSLPHLADSVEPSTNIALAEATHYHESQGYFPARAAEYGEDVRKQARNRAQSARSGLSERVCWKREIEGGVLTPRFDGWMRFWRRLSPIPAPHIGENEVMRCGRARDGAVSAGAGEPPGKSHGYPAISIPCGFTRAGLPVGLAADWAALGRGAVARNRARLRRRDRVAHDNIRP